MFWSAYCCCRSTQLLHNTKHMRPYACDVCLRFHAQVEKSVADMSKQGYIMRSLLTPRDRKSVV